MNLLLAHLAASLVAVLTPASAPDETSAAHGLVVQQPLWLLTAH